MARCRRMLQESPSEEQSSVDVDIRLTVIREEFDGLCQRSDRRSVYRYLNICSLLTIKSHYMKKKALRGDANTARWL